MLRRLINCRIIIIIIKVMVMRTNVGILGIIQTSVISHMLSEIISQLLYMRRRPRSTWLRNITIDRTSFDMGCWRPEMQVKIDLYAGCCFVQS